MVDHLPSKQGVASSNLVYCSTLYAGVAQLAEQLICTQQVAGSIPFTSSIRQGGRVAEWLNASVLKSEEHMCSMGSNPIPAAILY